VTQKLLNHFEIKTKTLSYHQHSKLKKVEYILDLLKKEQNLALVSDAGTPGISDPGNKLIEGIVNLLNDQVKIISIPGPSALTSAISISGFQTDRFSFLGFPPQKRKRNKFFQEVIDSKYPVIFYESPYRILKTLGEISVLDDKLSIVVCRELTKKFETIYRGTIKGVIDKLENPKVGEKIKGEFVIIVNSK
jgi:16S rRNA (cytidine1402-2'-O)-methyltransferase